MGYPRIECYESTVVHLSHCFVSVIIVWKSCREIESIESSVLSQLIVNIRYGIFVVLKNKMGPQEVFFFLPLSYYCSPENYWSEEIITTSLCLSCMGINIQVSFFFLCDICHCNTGMLPMILARLCCGAVLHFTTEWDVSIVITKM